jgi:uncharacterized Ntn-hydrolase superfamily protein
MAASDPGGILPGIDSATFSLVGRCPRTGMLGIAIATSEMAVGSRCVHVAPGVGAVITQASTDPRLGHRGLDLLRAGSPAARVLAELAASDPFVERRQLGCLDSTGGVAARTGSETRPWAGHRAAPNVVVAANMVVGAGVVDAMLATFTEAPDRPLWERLLDALEAGKAAGGEPGGEHSSALFVVDRQPFPAVDLRVDFHPEAVRDLRRLADRYFPLVGYYGMRPADPTLPGADDWLRRQPAEPGGD